GEDCVLGKVTDGMGEVLPARSDRPHLERGVPARSGRPQLQSAASARPRHPRPVATATPSSSMATGPPPNTQVSAAPTASLFILSLMFLVIVLALLGVV